VQRPGRRERIRGVGRGQRLVAEHEHHRVQVRVDRLDAVQMGLDDLARGDLPRRDQVGQLAGAPLPQLLGHPSSPPARGMTRMTVASPRGMALKVSLIAALLALALPAAASAAPEIRTVSGASPAELQATIDAFKANAPAQINWDGVPATATFPNRFPGGFFGGQRGATFDTPGTGTEISNGSPWGGGFKTYSGDKLLAPVGSNYTKVRFNVPGTTRQAFTSAFGVVLSDVDTTGGAGVTFLDSRGATLLEVPVPPGPNGLSFVGVRFRDGERVAEVQVRAGSSPIAPGVVDSPETDLAAIDDVLFADPLADLAPPPEIQQVPLELPGEEPAAGPRQRASLLPLAKSVRRNRTLKVVIGSSVDAEGELTLGKSKKTLTLEAGATRFSFKVPANAKKGKQKLTLTVGALRKSVSIRVI
jgi:hypothetical protein